MILEEKKIFIVFGTRPEAIKMAPVIKMFESKKKYFKTYICITGQHREMLDQVLKLFAITPDYDLNIMKSGQDLFDITTKVLSGLKQVIAIAKPDYIFVHGDTTTSVSAALAAFYMNVPVCHVEAGLRTYDRKNPWPEEMNRQLTSRLTEYHFAPTDLSKNNLQSEGVAEGNIIVTGNTVIDSLFSVKKLIESDNELRKSIVRQISLTNIPTAKLNSWSKSGSNSLEDDAADTSPRFRKLVLITGHRRENFGESLKNICMALKVLAEKYQDVDFVYPMHLNPNVRSSIKMVFGTEVFSKETNSISNIFFIEPLDYLPFIYLMDISYLVLTDSGGIQEEAPSLGKPVLVIRDTTERPEAITAGTVKLIGTSKKNVVHMISLLLDDDETYLSMSKSINPYGDGDASKRIVDFMLRLS